VSREYGAVGTPVSLPPMTDVVDFTLSVSTGTILYVVQSKETFILPMGGSSTATSLGLDEYLIEQLSVDPIGGLLYFTTTNQTVYCAQPDGSDVQYITHFDPQQCTIRSYLFANNGSVFIPTTCATQVRVSICTISNGICGSILLTGYDEHDGFALVGVFPEINSLMWSYAVSFGRRGTYVTSYTGGGATLGKIQTYAAHDDTTDYLLLGDCPEGQEQAIALNYCHFSGEFNGTHCRCNSYNYGDQCQYYCNPFGNCYGGICSHTGQCNCPVGYHLVGNHCEIKSAPPTRPSVYSTRYQEIFTSKRDEGIWWMYNAEERSGVTCQRQVENYAILYLQNYTQRFELIEYGDECRDHFMRDSYPSLLFPSTTLLVSNVSCPREETRECLFWQSPDGKSLFWTTLVDNTAVLWQEENNSEDISPYVRYYSLEQTSLTSLPEGWDDTIGCPCWTPTTNCRASPSPSPTPSPSHTTKQSRSSTRSGSPSRHSGGTPSRTPTRVDSTLSRDSGEHLSPVTFVNSGTSEERTSEDVKSDSGAPWVWIGVGIGAGLVFVLFVVVLCCVIILCWCKYRTYGPYEPTAQEMQIQGLEGDDDAINKVIDDEALLHE